MARSLLPICGVAMSTILAHSATALAVDCFIDSVGGNDSNTGLAEAQAVKSQAKIPASCTVAKFKRGSLFNEKVKVSTKITTYTNYGDPCDPLPKFSIPRSPNNGGMFSSYSSGVIVDGLYLSGSMSDEKMTNLMNGICVMLGSNSKLLNSELTNCDIGIMLSGTNNLVQGNYIHDLYISVDAAPGVDPNAVGGAEGIFVNGSDNEVAYNSFIKCTSKSEWTGGNCDGGATEVSVGAGKTMSGVNIHHNFSYQSCGFFEMASMAGSTKGTFADSVFHHNVHIDGGWLMLLQVNNTNTDNIRWENNTVVHRKGTAINAGMLVTVFTGYSSGVEGGSLTKDTVHLINDYFVLDGFGATDYTNPLDPNLDLVNTITIKGEDAGFVNIAGTTAADFDLVEGSPAIDKGTDTPNKLDFLNRTAPAGSAVDVGAFEYESSLASGRSTPIPAEELATGKRCGATGAGGAAPIANGGASTTSNGGAVGGASATAKGGASSVDGSTSQPDSGGAAGSTESEPQQGDGGHQTGSADASSVGGSGAPTGASGVAAAPEVGGCDCAVPGKASGATNPLWLAMLGLGLGLRRTRRNEKKSSVASY